MSIFREAKRVVLSSIHHFFEDDCYTKASTLAFYTALSIIPFLAFLFGIAKGFGLDQHLRTLIIHAFDGQKEVTDYLIPIANRLLETGKEGVVIGVGALVLFWAVINLLSYVELVLNQIWKIKEQRPFIRKVSDYLSIVILCPLLFIVSSSFTVILKAYLSDLRGNLILEQINTSFLWILRSTPWLLSWVLFFLLYYLMPNAKMRIWPRLLSAFLAGSAFQLWQVIYIKLQIQVFNYNVVYGSFSVVPLLLIWLQVSWLIALAGAEIAASIENVIFYGDSAAVKESVSRKKLGLIILLFCLEPFYSGKNPPTDREIAGHLKIPLDITRKMLDILVMGNILAPMELKNGFFGYHPYCDPGALTVKKVCDVIEKDSDFEIEMEPTDISKRAEELLNQPELSFSRGH